MRSTTVVAVVRGGGASRCFVHAYDSIITRESLYGAWEEFLRGKKNKNDVQFFRLRLVDNLQQLFDDLSQKKYRHGLYTKFAITDPKPREINKSSVRDRVVHHLLYTALLPYFDKKFIYDSYSCRPNKGTHRAVLRFQSFCNSVSKNNTRTCWVLKCDIRKFFASVDHQKLKSILARSIVDKDILSLLENIIDSFHTEGKLGAGLPLGNLTSQLLVNIYMNEFDQYVKHILKVKQYIRYADDFVVMSTDKRYLENLIFLFSIFLGEKLQLSLHPNKVFIKTIASGVDFLGWVHFPTYRILRTVTKCRMFKRLQNKNSSKSVVDSYRGMLSHGNAYLIQKKLDSMI